MTSGSRSKNSRVSRAPRKYPDWSLAKLCYVRSDMSYVELSRLTGVSKSRLAERGRREKWPAAREEYRADRMRAIQESAAKGDVERFALALREAAQLQCEAVTYLRAALPAFNARLNKFYDEYKAWRGGGGKGVFPKMPLSEQEFRAMASAIKMLREWLTGAQDKPAATFRHEHVVGSYDFFKARDAEVEGVRDGEREEEAEGPGVPVLPGPAEG